MDALEPDEIRGNWVPLLIPFDAQSCIAQDRLEEQLEALIAFEVDGIATGMEVERLTDEELDAVHTSLAQHCEAAGVPFQLATHAASIDAIERRVQRAARHAPGALRIRLPEAGTFEEPVAAHCLSRCAAAGAGIGLVWELSAPQQRALDGAALARLVEHQPALRGLDLAECDEDLLETLRRFEDELSIFVPGEDLASGWRRGARGSVSLLACLDPGRAQGYFEALEDELTAALGFELRVQRFLEVHVLRAAPVDAARAKLLCAIGDWCNIGLTTRPAQPVPAQKDVERLRALARNALPELF